MKKTRKVHGCRNSESGFSLIELAILMIVIGVLAVPLLQGYQISQAREKKGDSVIALRNVSGAVANFQGVQQLRNYPCPSDRSIAFGDAGHGVSDCAKVRGLAPNTCSAGNGMCKAVQNGVDIYIGGVPYATMGMPFHEMLDGYGNALTYAVTGPMTNPTNNPAFLFDANMGAIQITNENGLVSATLAHAVAVSHGENGAGSFNIYGQQKPCIMAYVESENCDNDGMFMSGLISLGKNNNYFDDLIKADGWTQSSIWEYATDEDVKSSNSGNVGVGTTTPTAKLDVAGDLKAENIRSGQICDANGQNCFPSATIGGAGIRCPAGRVLVGIANNAPVCENISISVTGTCPAGQFVVSVTAGGVQCAAP